MELGNFGGAARHARRNASCRVTGLMRLRTRQARQEQARYLPGRYMKSF